MRYKDSLLHFIEGVVSVKRAMHADKDVNERCSVGTYVAEHVMAMKNVVNVKIVAL